jgi:demethylmenaquinone methyltransferase/2-methoxy-6-polyprenyl-1,4-benzoquinol methylase
VQLHSTARTTADGYELTFGTNVIGHYTLIRAMLPHLAAPARVDLVTSATHFGDFRHTYGSALAITRTCYCSMVESLSRTERSVAMPAESALPPRVVAATARARQAGFSMSCDPAVGRLLAVLAAHLPDGARVLELGTGTGVGTAWIASGLLPRTDVTVISVEKDRQTAALAAGGDWPSFVDLRCGDALEVLAEGGAFDLIFADAPGGKWDGLDRSIAALSPRGMLVVDDMLPAPDWSDSQRASQDKVRQTLLAAPELTSAELTVGAGVILSVRASSGGAW